MESVVLLAVNGTLMRGLELNANLTNIGAQFIAEAKTQASYRLWSIQDRHPAMQKVKSGGTAIALEIWEVPAKELVKVLLQEPSGLCIGKVTLSDGKEVLGVLGEGILCEGEKEITEYGGWLAYLTALQK